MTLHDIVTAVLIVLALIVGMCIGTHRERKRFTEHVTTLLPTKSGRPHWQKQHPHEPIPESDI